MQTTKSTLNAQSQSPLKSSASDLPRSVDLIPISEAAERLGMTRGSFMTLRKSLGIAAIGYKINWPTVIQRIEESQNPTN
tara:strand:+ start:165 stop:404 length:240 start_codon:yes stop_codon:yes gene_type:complete